MHNTFEVKKFEDCYKCQSHNFPEFIGEGKTEDDAISSMSGKIAYYAKNKPMAYNKRIKTRMDAGLYCMCGVKLEEPALGIYMEQGE